MRTTAGSGKSHCAKEGFGDFLGSLFTPFSWKDVPSGSSGWGEAFLNKRHVLMKLICKRVKNLSLKVPLALYTSSWQVIHLSWHPTFKIVLTILDFPFSPPSFLPSLALPEAKILVSTLGHMVRRPSCFLYLNGQSRFTQDNIVADFTSQTWMPVLWTWSVSVVLSSGNL